MLSAAARPSSTAWRNGSITSLLQPAQGLHGFPGVMLNYGFAVPNDANLIGPTPHLVRRWGDAPVSELCSTEGGVVTPVARRAAELGSEKG